MAPLVRLRLEDLTKMLRRGSGRPYAKSCREQVQQHSFTESRELLDQRRLAWVSCVDGMSAVADANCEGAATVTP